MTDAEWEALKPYAERYDIARTAYQQMIIGSPGTDVRSRCEYEIGLEAIKAEFHEALAEFTKAKKEILHVDG